jgi:hypothetical protein
MRLIMCLTQDNIKADFLWHAHARFCQERDVRNSDVRPSTAFQLIADKWNNAAFNPVSPVSDCHQDCFCPLTVGIVKYLCWREHPIESGGRFGDNAFKPYTNHPKLGANWARRGAATCLQAGR